MTDTPRDLDRTLEAFLDTGPDQMSDRLASAIVADVHRTRQRGPHAPWRFPQMSRFSLITAGAVLAVGILGLALVMTRPSSNVGTATTRPTIRPTAAASFAELIGSAQVGQTYVERGFGEPFWVTIPGTPTVVVSAGVVESDFVLLRDTSVLRIRPSIGAITLLDDTAIPKNFCHRNDGLLADIPPTPSAVGQWLRASNGLMVSAPTQVLVDGRIAYRWMVSLPAGCDSGDATGSAIALSAGEHHAVYAIPTGKDTILGVVWGQDFEGRGEEQLPAINAWAEAFIKAMHFE